MVPAPQGRDGGARSANVTALLLARRFATSIGVTCIGAMSIGIARAVAVKKTAQALSLATCGAVAATALAMLAAPPAYAEQSSFLANVFGTAKPDATPWRKGFHNRIRLVRGHLPRPETPFQTALIAGHKLTPGSAVVGIELEVDTGWKTYWRAPGESGGIAPHFDFAKSRNVSSAQVLYPGPVRLRDQYGTSVGYKDKVLFPVIVSPRDASRPIHFHASLLYGVCKDICHPAEAELRLELSAKPSRSSAWQAPVIAALERVPALVTDPAALLTGVTVKRTAIDTSGVAPAIIIDLLIAQDGAEAATRMAEQFDLFVEAQNGAYVPVMSRTVAGASAPGVARENETLIRFRSDLTKAYDVPAIAASPLMATLVTDERSVAFVIPRAVASKPK